MLRQDIPVVVIFRALGFVADREILEHICYDFEDDELMGLFRPSLEVWEYCIGLYSIG